MSFEKPPGHIYDHLDNSAEPVTAQDMARTLNHLNKLIVEVSAALRLTDDNRRLRDENERLRRALIDRQWS